MIPGATAAIQRRIAGDSWVALVAALSVLAVTPVAVPAIAAGTDAGLTSALLLVGAPAAGVVLGVLVAAWFAPRVPPLRLLIGAEVALGVAGLACALAPGGAPGLVVLASLQGIAAGVLAAVVLPLLAAPRWTLGVVAGVVATVLVLAPAGVVVGAFAVTAPGWRMVYVLEGVAALLPAASTAWRSGRDGAAPSPARQGDGDGAPPPLPVRPKAVAAAVLLAVLPLQAAAGAAYETLTTSADAARQPPPGQLIDVGGHRLHIFCTGSGGPTVVLDAGGGEWSLDWTAVQATLSTTVRVCSYDRAGLGWSDPAPRPRTSAVAVGELRTLLRNAGEHGPFVVAGHSAGGMNVRLWAAQHPSEIAGMVLVDSTDPEFFRPPWELQRRGDPAGRLELCALWSPIGLNLAALQVGGESYTAGYPAGIQDRLIATVHRQGLCAARRDEVADSTESAAQLAAAEHPLGRLPLVVIRHGLAMFDGADAAAEEDAWRRMQERLATLSQAGRLVVADHAGHGVMLDQPQLVIDAIEGMLGDLHTRPAPPPG